MEKNTKNYHLSSTIVRHILHDVNTENRLNIIFLMFGPPHLGTQRASHAYCTWDAR